MVLLGPAVRRGEIHVMTRLVVEEKVFYFLAYQLRLSMTI